MMKRVQLVTLVGVLCSFAALLPGDATAQTQIKPRFVVILDSSGSMIQTPQQVFLGTANPAASCGAGGSCPAGFVCDSGVNLCKRLDGIPTHGDGSNEQPGCDLNGDGLFNDSKMFQAKGALSNVMSGYGEAEYALERYYQATGGPDFGACTNLTPVPNLTTQPGCNYCCNNNTNCPTGTTCQTVAGTGCASGKICVCSSGSCSPDFRCTSCPGNSQHNSEFSCINADGTGNKCWNCPVDFSGSSPIDNPANGLQDICFPTTYVECSSSFACSQCQTAGGVQEECNEWKVDTFCNGDPAPLSGSPATITCNSGNSSDPNRCIKYMGVTTDFAQTQCLGDPASGALAQVIVGFPTSFDNYPPLLGWINNTEGDGATNFASFGGIGEELRGNGATPLAGALQAAQGFLQTTLGSDTTASCRGYNVILVTDGLETCGGNPSTAATALRSTPIGAGGTCPGPTCKDVKTYVIGFGLCPASNPSCSAGTTLNAIASAGGTGTAFLAQDEIQLEAQLASIIQNSIPREICDCQDNNCDGQCDENFPQVGVSNPACSNQHSAQTCTVGTGACQRTGIFKCNGPNGVACCVNDGGSACSACTLLQPGAPGSESCPHNGIDDDCNGVIDDNSCPTPTPEVCNGQDDDLDGPSSPVNAACINGDNNHCDEWSEVFPCTSNTAPFPSNCKCFSGGTVSNCPASGTLPANCGCLPSCGSNVGACRPGLEQCIPNAPSTSLTTDHLVCVGAIGPVTEICNGIDDDCNGIVDDVPPTACYDGSTGCTPNGSGGFTCTGACRAGSRTCGACNGEVLPVSEIACNGIDDNCNGQIDEPSGQPCYPAGTPGCVDNGSGGFTCTGTCHAGTFTCQGGALVCVGAGTPSAEICDGLDNNCDGQVDNFNCGQAQGICTSRCTNPNVPGSTACTAGQPCSCNTHFGQTTETCNGQDDDCDGIIDNNLGSPFNQPCDPAGAQRNGQGQLCGICTPGTMRCISGAPVCDGATGPRPEVCNGLDDNCDCQVDNNIPGLGGACGSNVGACRQGTFQCTNGSVQCVGSTGPQPETCNGIDDDCNGVIDDNIPGAGNACYTAGPASNCMLTASPPRCNGQCRPGQLVCANGSMVCQGQIGPSTELCNGLDDDCDGVIDNGFNVGGPCTIMFGSCPSTGTLVCTVNGAGTVCNAPPVSSSPEICDGVDNNCDGVADEPNQIWPCPTSAPNPTGCICPTGRSCGNTSDLAFCSCPPQCGFGVGECQPGHLECANGQQRCVGGTAPMPETCNCLDDNCNGIVDDNPLGEGDACPPTDPNHSCNSAGVGCRSDETCNTATGQCVINNVTAPSTCRNGHKHCTSLGSNTCGFVCENAIGPNPEICDGLDNDCDGVIDNGAQCPPMYSCISGSCQPNCQVSEFPCTADRRCIDPSTGNECNPPLTSCVCLPNLCATAGCDPATQNCIILNGQAMCVDRCPTGHCTPPLQCEASTGMCLDCYSSQFACPSGQICVDNPGHCVPDPCAGVSCGSGEVCSNGQCIPSCNPPCPANEVCGSNGQCQTSPCPQCAVGEVCNPSTGHCENDMCMTQVCPPHQVCIPQTGQCEPDPCVTTHCPVCQSCETAFNGNASCQADPTCVAPPTINFTGIGGGGCACDVADHQAPTGIWLFGLVLGIVLARRGRGGRR